MAGRVSKPRAVVKVSLDEILAKGKRGGQKHTVVIIHEKEKCRVIPAVLHASPGDKIVWKFRNSTHGGRLFFPHEGLFSERVFEISPLPGESEELEMGKVNKGSYPYAVYCKKHERFGVGNSDPKIDYP